jgi:hypothetical protein
MNPEVTVKDTEIQISKVSVNATELSFLYTIKISRAYMTDEQAVNVVYPNGDDLYSIGNTNKKVNTLFERPAQVSADGTINMNPTATDPELLEKQTLELQDICEKLGVFSKTFKPKEFTTTKYDQSRGGIDIYTDGLFNGSFLKKDKDFQKLVNDIIYNMNERGLLNTMANSAKKSTSKVKQILDSLFPACDIEMRFPEKSIMESSSKVGKVLQKVKLSANGKFKWRITTNPDIDFGLDTAVALIGINTENPEQVVIFSFNDYPKGEFTEETYLAYNSAPEEGEAITGFKDTDDMINSVNEWQRTGNNEHVIVDDYNPPSNELIEDFKFWVKEYTRN